MSQLLLQRKASIKPIPGVKEPTKKSGIEFRWSVSASQFAVLEKNSSSNFHLVSHDNNQHKSFVFFIPSSSGMSRKIILFNIFYVYLLYTVQNSRTSRIKFSKKKVSPCSPDLPPLNDANMKKQKSISTNENNDQRISPLFLTYSQLFRTQHPSQMKKASETRSSMFPLLNNKRNHIPNVNRNISLSLEPSSLSTDQQQLTTNQYIRLRPTQLRRLHMTEKNTQEAKKLYFNAASKVFVPYSAITPVVLEE